MDSSPPWIRPAAAGDTPVRAPVRAHPRARPASPRAARAVLSAQRLSCPRPHSRCAGARNGPRGRARPRAAGTETVATAWARRGPCSRGTEPSPGFILIVVHLNGDPAGQGSSRLRVSVPSQNTAGAPRVAVRLFVGDLGTRGLRDGDAAGRHRGGSFRRGCPGEELRSGDPPGPRHPVPGACGEPGAGVTGAGGGSPVALLGLRWGEASFCSSLRSPCCVAPLQGLCPPDEAGTTASRRLCVGDARTTAAHARSPTCRPVCDRGSSPSHGWLAGAPNDHVTGARGPSWGLSSPRLILHAPHCLCMACVSPLPTPA